MDPPLESKWLYLNKGKAVSKVSRYLPFWDIPKKSESILLVRNQFGLMEGELKLLFHHSQLKLNIL